MIIAVFFWESPRIERVPFVDFTVSAPTTGTHMAHSYEEPASIWRVANSSGVKSFINSRISTGPGQIALQSWHSRVTRSTIAIAAASLFRARARMVSLLTWQSNCTSTLYQCSR